VLPASLVDGLPEAGEDPLACVAPTLLVRAARRGLLPPYSPSVAYSARILPLKAPADPEDAPAQSQSQSPVADKVLDLGRAGKGEGEPRAREARVRVVGVQGVPEGQLVIVGGTDRSTGDAGEWELVRCVSAPSRLDSVPTLTIQPAGPRSRWTRIRQTCRCHLRPFGVLRAHRCTRLRASTTSCACARTMHARRSCSRGTTCRRHVAVCLSPCLPLGAHGADTSRHCAL
jgi:hypothetical protein